MKIETWVYDGKGSRRQIYAGTGHGQGLKIAQAVIETLCYLGVTARVQVVELETMLSQPKPLYTRDVINGIRRDGNTDALFNLALDKGGSDAELEKAWQNFDRQFGAKPRGRT